jgi:branched-chain amino acid transport system permease protein
LETYGASVTTTRVLVFCCSAALAGAAGALFASNTGAISGSGLSTFHSLVWLTVLAISGMAVMRSAVVAAFLMAVLPSYVSDGMVKYQMVAFGVLAMLAALSTDRLPDFRSPLRDALRPTIQRDSGRSPVAERLDADVPWRGPTRSRNLPDLVTQTAGTIQ